MMPNEYPSAIVEFGVDGNPIIPDLILATKAGHKLGVIQNVSGLTHRAPMNDVAEISFSVNKIIDGEECSLWDSIKDFKLVYIPHFDDWFEIKVSISEDDETVKSCHGMHAQEAELSQRLLFETEINTEDDIARDDYVVTKFYNPDNPKGSLLNRLLADKGQDYEIRHVDFTLYNIQRTFNFNQKSIKDAFDEVATEVECLFVYGEYPDRDGQLHRTISAYDLLDYCQDCQTRGDYNGKCTNCGSTNIRPGFGEDTNIFINHENIANSVDLTSNADSVKNCFRFEAGDDVMTAVVRSINPNGSQYIWNFSDEMYADMSDELQAKLKEYYELFDDAEQSKEMTTVPSVLITRYNELVDKYKSYNDKLEYIESPITGTTSLTDAMYKAQYMYDFLKNTMMPGSSEVKDTTAEEQIAMLTVANLSPVGLGPDKNLDNVSVSTADSAVINYAKIYVDTARYRVTTSVSSYENHVWRGVITVSSFTDDEDIASTPSLTLEFNTADDTYIMQSIDKMIKKNEQQDMGTVAMFHKDNGEFAQDLRKHCLSNLQIFASVCTACLDILIEQGVGKRDVDLYSEIYLPYYTKSGLIEVELKTREQELSYLLAKDDQADWGLIDYIEKQQRQVRDELDIYGFLGEELWQELMAFRRDDVYQNQNFISDGLSDAELIDNAKQFYQAAMKEIKKSSTLQNSLSGNLQDFLLMPEFAHLNDQFKVGNKIHVEIDGHVYKLRMIEYEVNYDNLDKISIDFSDVVRVGDIISDTRSILDQARSIATTYDATARQAEKGRRANNTLNAFVENGLDLTSRKIVNSADSQNMMFDQNGLLMRRKDDFGDEYSLEQVKIINQGLYYTQDGWRSVSTGIGHFKYIDPQTGQEKDGYGVIANTVVGNLILGNDLKIFNGNGSMILDDRGSIFTLINGEDNSGVFKVRKQNPDGSYSDLIYVDSNGELVIRGTTIHMGGGTLESYVEDLVSETAGAMVINLSNEYIGISTDSDGNHGDYSGASTTVQVMLGQADITGDVTITATPSAGIVGVWDPVNYTYTVNNLTTNEGTVTFAVQYNGVTSTKVFKVAKIKEGKSAIRAEIDSTNGIIFKNGTIETDLTCRVYRGDVEITDSVTSFDWYRTLPDGTRDQTWNRLGAGSTIHITNADVVSRAVFKCDVTI